MEGTRVGTYALVIAIVGCGIQSYDLQKGEHLGMRRYPITAEDAFKCFEGEKFNSESREPSYYDFGNQYYYINSNT